MGDDEVDRALGKRLRSLRSEQGWSLEELARRSGVSRGTLSRIENAEVSATTAVLAKLCSVFGLTLSRLLRMVEPDFAALVRRPEQPEWVDPAAGFRRRSVSPPALPLAAEVLVCSIEPGQQIVYDAPPRPGLEHHLLLLKGCLEVTLSQEAHRLRPGDCLRYLLDGPSAFSTEEGPGAEYVLVTL